jgi:hypothetical protein
VEHVPVTADLRVTFTQRIIGVRRLVGNLVEHGLDKCIDSAIVLDQRLELDQHRM